MHPRMCWGCGLQPGLFVGACRGWRCPFSQTFVQGTNVVMSSLAALLYLPLHQGAARARRQPVRLVDLGQWSAVYIPWSVVAFGAACRRRQAQPFTCNACR